MLNDLGQVVISHKAFEFDGHKNTHSVNDRATGRLIGHVGRTKNPRYAKRYGFWCYLHTTDSRDSWTLGGWTLPEAVDKLMSADSPTGAFVAGVK